jgi:hypothetical protein
LINDDVIRVDPCDECEVAKRGKYVPWDPSPDKHPPETKHKVTISGNLPARGFRILIAKKSVEKGCVSQV